MMTKIRADVFDNQKRHDSRKDAKHVLRRSRRVRQVTGIGPSSRARARDLGKISPFGRNDKARCFVVLARETFLESICSRLKVSL